jgi:hypothetical protein
VPSDRVSEAIDRYLAAKPTQTDAIVEDMLRELNPDLVGKVTPDTKGKLSAPKQLATGFAHALEFYRNAYPQFLARESVELPDKKVMPAEELFLHSLPLDVLTFASRFQPGWMGRGYVWFTAFVDRAKLDAGKLVESAASLFEPLLGKSKEVSKAFETTITCNYTVGGYVRPKNVPAFRQWMDDHTEAMIKASVKENWDEAGARRELLKNMEALRDAERRGMGFMEAAEVYSGIMGIMN